MSYHQVQREDIEALRFLQNTNARLLKPRRGLKGAKIVSNYRNPEQAKSMELSPKMVKWFTTGGLVTKHKREKTTDENMDVYAITTRGRNFAERDLRAVGQRAEAENGAIKDIILKAVVAAGPKGITAAEINKMLLDKHGIRTHYKTVGMTLYRFSTEKLVRRKGWTWFAVVPRTPKAKPAAVPREPTGGETVH